ncbi:hypothetical protein I7R71_08590 [Neisseria meningitidis]|nr:hypothetical protein [Neisseria meningitidis]MBH2125675.1 hypothetical protein [Neisseria meningitidis]MBH2142372.1 hypothetical protein [Neisseria meningitidis]MBH2200271.1 hypothetical protein [Neisseria meningitidis]MBH2205933.1 hypothetical protein [Neisseria meningitidis]
MPSEPSDGISYCRNIRNGTAPKSTPLPAHPESPSEPNKIYRPNVIQYHISHIIITALPLSLSKPQIIMTPSLLLSGLTFRLVLALIAVSLLWGVYFWAVSA